MNEVTGRLISNSNALTTEHMHQALTSRPNVEAKLYTLLLFDILNIEGLVHHNGLSDLPIKSSVSELQIKAWHFLAPRLKEVDRIDLVDTSKVFVQFLSHVSLSEVLCVHQLNFIILTQADESIQHIARRNFLFVQEQMRRVTRRLVLEEIVDFDSTEKLYRPLINVFVIGVRRTNFKQTVHIAFIDDADYLLANPLEARTDQLDRVYAFNFTKGHRQKVFRNLEVERSGICLFNHEVLFS